MDKPDDMAMRAIALAIAAISAAGSERIMGTEIIERAERFRRYIEQGKEEVSSR